MKRTPRQTMDAFGAEVLLDNRETCLARLGDFSLRKDDYSYYYVVNGPMPIEAARAVYAHPVGHTDVRAGGHGCAEPPDKHGTWRLDGEEVIADPDGTKEAEWDAWTKNNTPTLSFVFTKDPAAIGAELFVESYHVDSELGLYVLVEAIRSLSAPAEPVREYLELFSHKLDYYERVIQEAQTKCGPSDGLDHLKGLMRVLRTNPVLPLRKDDEVERILLQIAGDLGYHRRTLTRCLEAVGPIDALGSFWRLVKALDKEQR